MESVFEMPSFCDVTKGVIYMDPSYGPLPLCILYTHIYVQITAVPNSIVLVYSSFFFSDFWWKINRVGILLNHNHLTNTTPVVPTIDINLHVAAKHIKQT